MPEKTEITPDMTSYSTRRIKRRHYGADKANGQKSTKLCATFYPKKDYKLHIRLLKLYISLGQSKSQSVTRERGNILAGLLIRQLILSCKISSSDGPDLQLHFMESTGTETDSKAESLDGTSPHKDTGLLGGGMPTATVPKEGYLANQQIAGTNIASPKKLTMTSSISLVGSTLPLKI
ncbi:hypothetical protein ACHWQZ_G015654 [Mnemiopsis leidyi]